MTIVPNVEAAGPLHRRIIELEAERDQYKIWWERDSKNLGTALNDLSLERIYKQDLQAQVTRLERESAWQSKEIDAQAQEIQRLRGHEPSAPQERRETGWLVENGRSGSALRYRSMSQGMSIWTADHQEAIRFARRKDAELFAAEDEDAWCIVEHQWITLDGDSIHSNTGTSNASE